MNPRVQAHAIEGGPGSIRSDVCGCDAAAPGRGAARPIRHPRHRIRLQFQASAAREHVQHILRPREFWIQPGLFQFSRQDDRHAVVQLCHPLQADAGGIDVVIVAALHVSIATVEQVRKRFVDEGLEATLREHPCPGGNVSSMENKRLS